MTLITCVECGNEFSDKASACPKCGCPIEFARPKANPMPDPYESPQTALAPESTTEQSSSEEKQVGGIPGKENSIKNEAGCSYLERRAKCSPSLIGICVWFFTPFVSILWGIRQRSWLLALAPIAFAVVLPTSLVALGIMPAIERNDLSKYVFQAIGAVAAFGISLELMKDAKIKGYGKPKKKKAD